MGLRTGGGGDWSGPWIVDGDDCVGGFALVSGYESGVAGSGGSDQQDDSAGYDDGSQDSDGQFGDGDGEDDERT